MRHALRRLLCTRSVRSVRSVLSAGIALGGAGLIAAPQTTPPLPPLQAHAVRLTHSDAADAPLGGGTAFLMGPSTLPIPPQGYLDLISQLYLQPRGFTGTPQSLFTPEGLYPVSGVKSLPYDTSVAQGRQILDSTILGQIQDGHASAQDPVVVFGWSQSSGISSLVMSQLAGQHVDSDLVHFVLVGDTNNPNGGLFDRFDGLAGASPTLAPFGFTLGGGPTPDDLYPTDVYTNEYDVVADFPRYPIDWLSDLNAALGIIQHIFYPALTAEQIASAQELPVTSADTMTNFYMIPATTLPLLFPLEFVPVVGQPLYDLLEPDARVLVNLGYGNIDNGWDPGPANLATPFGLLPHNSADFHWGDVLPALADGVKQGISDAIAQLRNPDNYKLSSILENPVLTDLLTVVHAFGFTDATQMSQLLNLSALLELARNGLGDATGFPMYDVSLFSSSPSEVVNAITGTLAADYSTLLPAADGITSMLTSVPAYDVSVITHQLEAGNLLGALTDPLLADETLLLFGPTLAGSAMAVALGGTLVNLADLFGLGGDL